VKNILSRFWESLISLVFVPNFDRIYSFIHSFSFLLLVADLRHSSSMCSPSSLSIFCCSCGLLHRGCKVTQHMQHSPSTICFGLLSLFNNVMSHSKTSFLSTCPNHLCFCCQRVFNMCLFSSKFLSTACLSFQSLASFSRSKLWRLLAFWRHGWLNYMQYRQIGLNYNNSSYQHDSKWYTLPEVRLQIPHYNHYKKHYYLNKMLSYCRETALQGAL